ncbi:WG repeat-containing protein [Maribacter sp. 2-571]|uniref:WG repeat-containing protein n=1 Tax=Maribacter sp. 2-571 TaxID=3417569 RepID=UPI003D350D63
MKRCHIILLFLLTIISQVTAQELALVREGDRFGYIDKQGNYAIEPQFKKAKSFSDGLASAQKDDLWGYIDASGKWVIEPQYKKAKYFNSGIALVNKDDQWQYIQKSGTVLEVPEAEKYYDFEDGAAIFKKLDKVGLLGADGKLLVEPSYNVIKKIRNGHAKVSKGVYWGMINTKGEVVIPAEYEELGNTFHPSGVDAKKNGRFGIVRNGTFYPIDGADKVWSFYEDAPLTYARKDKKIGFVDGTGKWVIPPTYDKARAFSQGLAPVAQGKQWGYIDEKGALVISATYRDAEVFSKNGLAPVKDKKWGFMDTSGKLVIPMEYDITAGLAFLAGKEQKGFQNGLVRVKSKKGWAFLKEDGTVLGNKWYANVEPFVVIN